MNKLEFAKANSLTRLSRLSGSGVSPVRKTGALRFQMAALNSRLWYNILTPQRELGAFSNGVNMAKEKFEDALEKLEDIVRKMESGDMPLDEALKSFEEGIKIIRFCSSKLEETERRVEMLLEKENSLQVKNFQGEDSDSR